MKITVLDPGHKYEFSSIDGDLKQIFQFVKREGPGYPGNVGSYPGANLQSVFRMGLDRIAYLDNQIPDENNMLVAGHVGMAIYFLEKRAAIKHGRKPPTRLQAVAGDICLKCGHVGCEGECHS